MLSPLLALSLSLTVQTAAAQPSAVEGRVLDQQGAVLPGGGDQLDLPPHEAEIAESIDSRRTSGALAWYHQPAAGVDYRITLAAASTDRDSSMDRGPFRDAGYVYGPRTPRTFGISARVEF